MSTRRNYSARRKKMKEMKESDFNDDDRISRLPDDLLHHIFSFLDMIFVFQTSILARRWRYLWISQPIMNFDQEVYNPRYDVEETNMRAVYRAKHQSCMEFLGWALSHHSASTIHTFRLSCINAGRFWEVLPFSTWLPILDRCKVEVIDALLDMSNAFGPYTAIELPGCLFGCKSLTTLKLDLGPNKSYGFYTSLPDCGSKSLLPSLKTLHLTSFYLDNNEFQKFLSKCPVLETLLIFNCSLGSSGLDVQLSQLKNLVLETTDCDHRVRVIAPNLESFRGKGSFPIHDYRFENIKSLVKADIDTDLPYHCLTEEWYQQQTPYCPKVMECLRGLCNVESLILSAWLLELAIEFLVGIENLPMKPFRNLRVLTLKTSFSKRHIHATKYLLEKCQNMETLVLKITKPPQCFSCLCEVRSNAGKKRGKKKEYLEVDCKMYHLKVVEIWDVESNSVFDFVKFLMKNAVVLEKVILYSSKTYFSNLIVGILGEKLASFPSVSSRTEIFINHHLIPRKW